jgi:hypothetical protein
LRGRSGESKRLRKNDGRHIAKALFTIDTAVSETATLFGEHCIHVKGETGFISGPGKRQFQGVKRQRT